ncbi:MAG: proton-conducting transporter membrane subunit [bacterium]
MSWFLVSLAVLLLGGVASLLLERRTSIVRFLGPTSVFCAAALGLGPVALTLTSDIPIRFTGVWSMPFGSLAFKMDALSAIFAGAILVISALSALFGAEYLRPQEGAKRIGMSWFCFNVLVASMLIVVTAQNAVLFLLAWEIMSLASFFLVMFDYEEGSVRRAGWTYLIATHIGTAFLLVMFLLLGRDVHSLDFDAFATAAGATGAGVIFFLAIIGFGTKAGFMPLHVWLPEAHPAAPSHVSALMSGVMIKTGIYGLVRILTLLGPPPAWYGWTLLCIGAASGVLGVLFALAQHDVKRLLAYHSVENIGIITIGLGVGMLGVSLGNGVMVVLGFSGAFLHVVNHAVFKSLLFLSAGSVFHATGTREMDYLGGLWKRMPLTGAAFLIGAVAICGLPPLSGFVSEFAIYLGAFFGVTDPSARLCVAGVVAVGSLALIGGLAAACFTKAFGVMFLGEGRSPHVEHAHDPGLAMRIPMMVLAALCLAIGLAGPVAINLMAPAVGLVAASWGVTLSPTLSGGTGMALWGVTTGASVILALAACVLLLRARLLSGRSVAGTVTWDCGYAATTPRMQYTSSSFAQPITRFFTFFLRTERRFTAPQGLFPDASSFSSETPDVYREHIFKPVFAALEAGLSKFRWLQHGRLNLYILYLVAALLAVLAWKMR